VEAVEYAREMGNRAEAVGLDRHPIHPRDWRFTRATGCSVPNSLFWRIVCAPGCKRARAGTGPVCCEWVTDRRSTPRDAATPDLDDPRAGPHTIYLLRVRARSSPFDALRRSACACAAFPRSAFAVRRSPFDALRRSARTCASLPRAAYARRASAFSVWHSRLRDQHAGSPRLSVRLAPPHICAQPSPGALQHVACASAAPQRQRAALPALHFSAGFLVRRARRPAIPPPLLRVAFLAETRRGAPRRTLRPTTPHGCRGEAVFREPRIHWRRYGLATQAVNRGARMAVDNPGGSLGKIRRAVVHKSKWLVEKLVNCSSVAGLTSAGKESWADRSIRGPQGRPDGGVDKFSVASRPRYGP
jgi:hypothetical protein